MENQHGGNIREICSTYDLNPANIIDFSANINPLGYPANIECTISSNIKTILHYPDPDCSELKKALAKKYACDNKNIVVGNGSTELFYLIPRAILAKQGFLFQPTFSEFRRAFQCNGILINEIKCNEEDLFKVDINKIYDYKLNANQSHIANGTTQYEKIIFLCSPNNPTGYLIKKDDILKLTNDLPDTLVVVDEAFMEFTLEPEKNSVISYASKTNNLIVVRSLTKLFGIPGIRLGFLVAHYKTVEKLLNYKEPWSVNSFAQFCGTVSIKDERFIVDSREYTNKEKAFLFNELSKIRGIQVFEPSVNFILVKITIDNLNATILYKKLIKFGIVIRNCSNFTTLSEKYFRIAVRRHDENVKLLDTIKKVIK